jgi:ABC-type sugar transport system permease subunit
MMVNRSSKGHDVATTRELKHNTTEIPRRSFLSSESGLASFLITPALLLTVALIFIPLITTVIYSVYDANLSRLEKAHFVGLEQYADFLRNSAFWQSIGRTAYFTFFSVGLELVLGMAIAMLIEQKRKLFGWRFLRVAILIPWAVPTIVTGAMWRWIYAADYGALNGLLIQLGVINRPVPWLADPSSAMNLVIVADVWHSVPFVVLLIAAALATLPGELEEASALDGANAWQHFFYVTLPLLRPAILVVLVIRSVEAFRVFDIIYIMTRGGPVNSTMVISYLTYQKTFSDLKVGEGSTLSFIVSAFTLILAGIYVRLLYSRDE